MFNLYPVSIALRAEIGLAVIGVIGVVVSFLFIDFEAHEGIEIIRPMILSATFGIIGVSLISALFTGELKPVFTWLSFLTSLIAVFGLAVGYEPYWTPEINMLYKILIYFPFACWIAIFIIAKWAITGKVYRNSEQTSDIK